MQDSRSKRKVPFRTCWGHKKAKVQVESTSSFETEEVAKPIPKKEIQKTIEAIEKEKI